MGTLEDKVKEMAHPSSSVKYSHKVVRVVNRVDVALANSCMAPKLEQNKKERQASWNSGRDEVVKSKSEVFMTSFMEKLEEGTLKKEIEPSIEPSFIPTNEFISAEVESYSSLLEQGIINDAVKQVQGPVLKKKI